MNSKFWQRLDNYVDDLTDNYEENSDIISFALISMPNKESIINIINMLRDILFPGYFGKPNPYPCTMKYQAGELLDRTYVELHKQVCMVYTIQDKEQKFSKAEISKKTEDVICEFFDKLIYVRNMLTKDIEAAFDGDPAARDTNEIILSYPGVLALIIFRLAHELFKLEIPLIPRVMTEYAHGITGIDIHPGAEIGEYFFIDHGTGTVIGETTTIGNHVKLYQGVTLGALSTRGGQSLKGIKRHPTLEDSVVVYSGASILGGETVIGKGVTIGSNVFITESISSETTISLKNQELIIVDRNKKTLEENRK